MSTQKRDRNLDLLHHYTTLSKSLPSLLAEAGQASAQHDKKLNSMIATAIDQMQAILEQLNSNVASAAKATLIRSEEMLNTVRSMLKILDTDQNVAAIAKAMACFLNYSASVDANYGPGEIIKSARVIPSEKSDSAFNLIVETSKKSTTTVPVYDYPAKKQRKTTDLDLTHVQTHKYVIVKEHAMDATFKRVQENGAMSQTSQVLLTNSVYDIIDQVDHAPHHAELGDFLAAILAKFLRLYKIAKKPLGIYTIAGVQVIGSELIIKVEDENGRFWNFSYQVHNFGKDLLEEQLRHKDKVVPSSILDM